MGVLPPGSESGQNRWQVAMIERITKIYLIRVTYRDDPWVVNTSSSCSHLMFKKAFGVAFADKPPCPSNLMMSDTPSAPLDAGLSFNMVPGNAELPTAPPQTASVLSAPYQDNAPTPTPTKAKILLHNDHPEEPTKSSGSQPNRDQLYHIKGNRKYMVILLSSYFVNDVFMQKLTSSREVALKILACVADAWK